MLLTVLELYRLKKEMTATGQTKVTRPDDMTPGTEQKQASGQNMREKKIKKV